ncbi:MFS transporter [Streptomyces griseoincarnatus]
MPSRLPKVFTYPAYRRLWTASTLSRWGDAFHTVALPLLVLHLTGSGLGVGTVVVAEIVPVLLLAPVAGAVVDRISPLKVMITADLVRAALVAVLPLVYGNIGAVYAIAFGLSAASVFFNPATGALLPRLVGEKDLVTANSGIWTAAVLSQIALAPAAGLLIVAFGFAPAFLINAASFAFSAVVLVRLPLAARPSLTPHHGEAVHPVGRWRRWAHQAGGGIHLIAGDRLLRTLAAGQLLAALSAGATSALLVVLAADRLGLGPAGYGWLLAAIGVGAAAGPLLVLRRVEDPRRPVLVFGPFALRGGVDLTLAATTNPIVAGGALAAYGVGTSTGAVTFTSLLQATAPETHRGRVLAAFDMLWQTGRLASLLVGGLLADTVGVHWVFLGGGILLLAAAALGFTTRIRPMTGAQDSQPDTTVH